MDTKQWIKKYFPLTATITGIGLCGIALATSIAIITEKDIEYGPEELTVHVGQPLQIRNEDPFDHKSRVTLQKSDGGLGAIALKDHVDKPGTTFTFKLDKPGTYQIRCMLHDGMTAMIKVVE